MEEQKDKQRKQDLGIYYTPPEVVDFIFDILNIWKNREDKETGRWTKRNKTPSIIDPAVGEGIFLKTAIDKNFTKPDWIFGLDIDEKVVNEWKAINLLKEFGGKENDLEAHFFHQNGLDKIHWEQHKDKYKYKLKQVDIQKQQFNTVVGNPPYGGIGINFHGKLPPESKRLLYALAEYEIFWYKRAKQRTQEENKQIQSLFVSDANDKNYGDNRRLSNNEVSKIIEGIPIEILFVERFIQLAQPNGWIAIIIPDGILANSNSHYVREFIADKTKVEAIVSLPRGTFKGAGTSAKTSILFLRKYPEDVMKNKINLDYRVFLASIEQLSVEYFNIIVERYNEFYNLENKL